VGNTLTKISPKCPLEPVAYLDDVLAMLSCVYEATKIQGLLDIKKHYLERIKEKISILYCSSDKIRKLVDSYAQVNGTKFKKLSEYLLTVQENCNTIQPGFLTAEIGDLFPENLTLDSNGNIRIIDPSPYSLPYGDWAYDVGTLMWWFKSLGAPTDRFQKLWREMLKISVKFLNDAANVYYEIPMTTALNESLTQVNDWAEKLATKLNDTTLWKARVSLAEGFRFIDMARKAITRYHDEECAIMLYAMGLIALDRCVNLLGGNEP